MKNYSVALGCFICLATGALFGADNTWNKTDGSWDDPAHWSLKTVPQDGNTVVFPDGGTYTVTLPSSNIVVRPYRFYSTVVNNDVFTFDGRGGQFLMPSSETDVYHNEPWGLRSAQGHYFNMELYNISGAPRHAIVAMSNVLFTSSSIGNNSVRFDLDEGLLNFYDPEGTAYANHLFTVAAYTPRDIVLNFHSNATVRLPTFNFRGNASRTNLVAFLGGSHQVLGSFNYPSSNFMPAICATGTVLVTDGADVTFAGVSLGAYVNGGASTNRTFRLIVEKDATLTTGNISQPSYRITTDIDVRDGGHLVETNTLSLAAVTGSTGTVRVINGATADIKTLVIGAGGARTGQAELYASNACVNSSSSLQLIEGRVHGVDARFNLSAFYPGYGDQGNPHFSDCLFDGCVVTTKTVYCGLNTEGRIALRNGTSFVGAGSEFILGKDASATGTLVVADATVTARLGASSAQYVRIGNDGTGTLVISNGTVVVPSSALALGKNGGSHGVLEMLGGTLDVTPLDGIVLGMAGEGRFNMRGGTVTAQQMRLNWGGNAATPTGILYQTGGLLKLTYNGNDRGLNVCDSSGTHGRLILDGGVLQNHLVRGWTGATAKGGGGWAALEANGGTIRSDMATSALVATFDEAVLGPKGLTLESDYDATIPQNFADKPGNEGEGRLILAGAGLKTITSTDSCESYLDVVGGTASFASGARHTNAYVTVTNAAVLALTGNVSFRGLALGSSASLGQLRLYASSTTISLKGEPSLGNFCLALEDAEAVVGTNTLITCPAPVSAATRAAWASGFVATGRQSGYAYTFITEDEDDDTVAFRLAVTEGTPITEASRWQGTDGDWTKPANWSNGLPGGAVSATFSSDDATGTLAISGEQTVGALAFDAAIAYTLNGTGSLRFSDSGYPRFDATNGPVTLNVPVTLAAMTTFNVEAPAAVTLNGPLSFGGIEKTGTGMLTLTSPENAFSLDLMVDDGLLAFTQLGALGASGTDALVLAGGTCELGPDVAGTMPRALRIEGSANQLTALKNDSDVTFTAAETVSGDFVKRGAGTLTFAVEGSTTLSKDNGTCNINGTPKGDKILFPSNGVLPTLGYCGFNVADGTVRFTGGTYTIPNAIAVGLGTPDVSDAEPTFVVDGATVNTGCSSYHFLLGANAYKSNGSAFTHARLEVKNGGYLKCDTLNVGRSADRDTYPEVHLDNGTLYGSWTLNISEAGKTHAAFSAVNGSKLLARTELNWRGPAELVFTNSMFAASTDGAVGSILAENSVNGSWLFAEGSEFRCGKITQKTYTTITFAFAGGRWIPALSGGWNFVYEKSDRIRIETRSEEGLKLAPPASAEYRMAKAVTGEGGMTMDGAGTLRFVTQEIIQDNATNKVATASSAIKSPFTLDFAGPLTIASGTVVVEDGAARTNAVFAGTGTLTATNCASPVLKLAVDNDYTAAETLTLADCSFTGRPVVNLGRTEATPLTRPFKPIVVARYTGSAPDVANWKVRGTGLPAVSGACTAADGVITATLRTSGFTIFFK